MNFIEAREEYTKAMRAGLKDLKELLAAGKPLYPAVLDDILPAADIDSVINIGLVEIPAERIVGTKTSGRVTAFSANFLPLLNPESEFAAKWVNLCAAHLSDEGIRDHR